MKSQLFGGIILSFFIIVSYETFDRGYRPIEWFYIRNGKGRVGGIFEIYNCNFNIGMIDYIEIHYNSNILNAFQHNWG